MLHYSICQIAIDPSVIAINEGDSEVSCIEGFGMAEKLSSLSIPYSVLLRAATLSCRV